MPSLNRPLTLRKIPGDLPQHAPPIYRGPVRPQPMPMQTPRQPMIQSPASAHFWAQAPAHFQQAHYPKPKKRQLKFHVIKAAIFGGLTVGSLILGLVASSPRSWLRERTPGPRLLLSAGYSQPYSSLSGSFGESPAGDCWHRGTR